MRFVHVFTLAAVFALWLVTPSNAQDAPPKAQPAGVPDASMPAPSVQTLKPAKKKYDSRDVCITREDADSELTNKRRHVGGRIILDTFLLPTGQNVDVGLEEPFNAETQYFGALLVGSAPAVVESIIDRQWVRSRQATETDSLVKKGLLKKDATIVSLQVPDIRDAPWSRADFYIFTCQSGSPLRVSETTVRASPALYSSLLAWLSVAVAYFFAARAFAPAGSNYWHSVGNPIAITSGVDGKASLGKLQVLLFSLIVCGLITYLLLKTGTLTDISNTVLLLLGIAGVGSTVAKGTDLPRTTFTPENRAWLLRKKWLLSVRDVTAKEPTWRDLFSTDGEFDVYRYQSFIFSIVVAGALLIGGVTQLASFEIPTTLLGILGLSQVVYISGKVVTPTSMGDLNKALDSLRDAEKKFRTAAIAANNNVLPATVQQGLTASSQPFYDAYRSLATDVATLFTDQTDITVDAAKLEPSL
jgi:hypothetical protein